jgi:hypothetical protein
MASALFSSIVEAAQATPLFTGCVVFQALRFALDDVYVAYREKRAIQQATQRPPELQDSITEEEFEKSRSYALDSATFSMA